MGSFSVACGISKLPITSNEKAIFVFLEKNKTNENKIYFLNNTELYRPVLLPIKGTYNTYGLIENIEKDINVELIEKHFKMDIDRLLEFIRDDNTNLFSEYGNSILDIYKKEKQKIDGSFEAYLDNGFEFKKENNIEFLYNKEFDLKILNRDVYKEFNFDDRSFKFICNNKEVLLTNNFKDIDGLIFKHFNIVLGLENKNDLNLIREIANMNGMYIKRDIYNELTKVFYNDYPSKVLPREEKIKNIYLSEEHLKALGFKKEIKEIDVSNLSIEEIFEIEFENNIYQKDNIKIEFGSYGSKILEPIKSETIYEVEKFIKIMNTKYNQNININLIKDLVDNKLEAKKIVSEIERKFNVFGNKLNKEFIREIQNVLITSEYNLFNNKNISNYRLYNNYIRDEIIEQINNKKDISINIDLINILDDFKYVKNNMEAGNIMFMPSFCAYQEGSLDMNKYINKITSNSIKNKNKEDIDLYNDLYK